VRVFAKVSSKLVNLDVDNNFVLAKVGINLVALTKALKLFSFMILMSLKVSKEEPKSQGARQLPNYILDTFNKFLEVLPNELLYSLPPYEKVEHKIKMCIVWPCHPRHLIG